MLGRSQEPAFRELLTQFEQGSIWRTQMRITKKWLRTCKVELLRRAKELLMADSKKLSEEFLRMYAAYGWTRPKAEELPDEREMLRTLMVDLIELSIPSHLVDY